MVDEGRTNARYSAASLLCRRSAPSTPLMTSREAGWTSVFMDHNRVEPDEEPFETRPTPDQTIVMLTRGEQHLEAFRSGAWQRAVYRAGTIGMTPAGQIDRLRRRKLVELSPFEKINLYIPQLFFDEAADHYRRSGCAWRDRPLVALAFDDPLVSQTLFAMARGMAAGAPDLYAQTAVQWLCVHLLAAHSPWRGAQEDRRSVGAISDKRLARVLEYMGSHFAEPLSLEVLAAKAGISKFHFARLFRQKTGATPHAFLIQLRMEAARPMLTTTDFSVAEVASRCGFASVAHFGTAFTKRHGISAAAYRSRANGA